MNVLLLMLLNNFSIYLWQTTSQQRLMEAQGQEQEDLAGKIRANCIPSALQAKWPVSSMLRNRRQNSSKAASFMRCGHRQAERHGQECASGQHALSAETEAECQAVFSHWGKAYPATMVKDISLPFFDIGIVAGFPIPLDNDEKSESIELLQMLCPHPESSYLIRVEGSSMIDAGICSGDIVIVDKSNRSPSPNEVAVCELNGEYTLKRFEKRGGEGWLIPANPDYPEIRVGEGDSFSIWGTVTYVIHKPHSK